jgi:hypothetical protein
MSQIDDIESICFLPPLAIGRVGGGDTPLDSFVWDSDRTIHGAHRTIIRPAMSLEVLADGSLRPFLPNSIQFRDRGLLRPVAPFFELWVTLVDGSFHPLTSTLLEQCGASLDNVEYKITVANRKAQRRTGSAACAYIARASANAGDHRASCSSPTARTHRASSHLSTRTIPFRSASFRRSSRSPRSH